MSYVTNIGRKHSSVKSKVRKKNNFPRTQERKQKKNSDLSDIEGWFREEITKTLIRIVNR